MQPGHGAQNLVKKNNHFTFVVVCPFKLLSLKHFALVGLKPLAFLWKL
jgi:hypothetical protein